MIRRPFLACILSLVSACAASGSCNCADAIDRSGERPAGELRCEVTGGVELLASANRNLDCRYIRLDRRVELYTGYTGITGANLGKVVPRTLVYQVFSRTPRALVPLAGDFKGSFGASGGLASNELAGGDVILLQLSSQTADVGSTSFTAPINAVAGFGYLHLIYAGVVPAERARRRRR